MVKVGINGFGRIGRLFLRAAMEKALHKCAVTTAAQVVAINDPFLSAEQMAYLFTYDSNVGIYPGVVTTMGNCIVVDGQRIEASFEKEPEKIPWQKNCVEYVLESTGKFKNCATASKHLVGGAKRTVISAPSDDAPMFVMGVNHDCYDPCMTVVSCASCTTNALAPLVKVIHDSFEVDVGLMTTIHAVTGSQKTVDLGAKKWRLGRGALQNLIPTTTGAAKAIGKIIPELAGKITGISVRAPVPTVSMIDLTVKLNKEAEMDKIKCRIKQAADTYMKGILGYTDAAVVSSDFIGDPRSSIFDATACVPLTKCFVKLISWYDNETGYACRVLDFINYMSSREPC